jgi:RND family efflux transporter MFP subunit
MSHDQYDLSKLTIQRGQVADNGSPRNRKAYLLYAAGALFLALAAFFFFKNTLAREVEVETTTVLRTSSSQASALLTASGYVVAQRKASVASKATGRLVYLGYREGDRVKKNEIIARIESADVEAQRAQALADLGVAKADKINAQQTLERAKQLLSRNLISQAEYDQAEAQDSRVAATIASREASLQNADVAMENTRIRAPFDGTVLSKNADIGEVVAPFAAGASSRVAVVTIADMSSLEVEADVSESNIQQVKAGQPCEISLDAYPDRRYRGSVDKIVPTADRAKATVLTKIRFEDRDDSVLPEMSAKVHFLNDASPQSADNTPKLVLDPAAIVSRQGGKAVFFVTQDNIAVERAVTTGGLVGKFIEIQSGAGAGDRVVLRPPATLKTGDQIKQKQD